jgi:uncharacterized protein (TIGR03437 family)
MFRLFFACISLLICTLSLPVARAASLTCTPSTMPAVVHGEGITERTGDIVLTCSGGNPNATLTANLFIFLNVDITNRLTSGTSGAFTGVTLTADNGSGPQPVDSTPTQIGAASLVFNGATFSLSQSGSVTLRLAGLRGAANELDFAANSTMQVLIGLNPTQIFGLTTNQLTVGIPEHGLYDGFSSKILCSQSGSPLPADTSSLTSFLASKAAFGSTRVTEGYADSFGPLSAWQNLSADSGTRILVQYSGFPPGARLFVPTAVAGSDATKPTAGGDLGLPASGGQYTPGNPSLLLSFVQNTDANGAGGTPLYTPGAPGSGTVSFDSMSEVTLTNGSGIAVYEVVDANPSIQESAQFPTFLALSPFSGTSVQTNETVSLAPISTVYQASAKDPIPRFQHIEISEDCSILGDCGAGYFPRLFVVESSLSFSATADGQTQTQYVIIQNPSGGVLQWNASLAYTNGSGWLKVSPTSGQNDSGIRVDALPGTLAPGTYNATLTIDAGPLAGTRTVPITLVIAPATIPPPVQAPTVQAIANAATFAAGPVAPGSIATLGGTGLSGSSVTVTFDSLPGQILFNNETQMNVVVPAALSGKTFAQLVVTVDGTSSAPFTVSLAPFAPGIFQSGVLNQDDSVNSAQQPAAPGSVIQIFATGLAGTGSITAKIGNQIVAQPYYGGPAPGLTGVQQVNLILPSDLAGSTVNVSVCGGTSPAQSVCSPPVSVAISQ